ncbi:MAG: aminotransferase class I/II-fold pyridoxal phosphate-dependent enzyme [Thermoanaerobaculia bacterium]|jgi:aspartate/methionine/tyrosine aminotransferase
MIAPARRTASVSEYYFSRKLAEVRRLDEGPLRVINLGIGSPDMAPSAEVIETLSASARSSAAHGYQSYRGVPELRRAIAEFSRDVYGTELDPETMILPLMGSKEGIMHVSMAFLDEGDEVLIPDPGYPTYASAARLAGAVPRSYTVHDEGGTAIDLDALEARDLSRVKLMWVNFPHMPTGRVASQGELARIVALARRHGFLVVNDNPYSLILNDAPRSILAIEGAMEVALELNSLSKSHNMAGWRVGWVAGSREHVDAVLLVKSNMDSGMFLPLQLAAAKALASRDEWFAPLNATYAERRRRAGELVEALGCDPVESRPGLFVWAKAPDAVADVEAWLDEILHATKVFITPGFVFGEAGRRHLRVSLCRPAEAIGEAVERVSRYMESRAAHAEEVRA